MGRADVPVWANHLEWFFYRTILDQKHGDKRGDVAESENNFPPQNLQQNERRRRQRMVTNRGDKAIVTVSPFDRAIP